MLPRPLKPPAQSHPLKALEDSEPASSCKYSRLDPQYDDRRTYRNLSIYITELPPTPTRFRDKYTRNFHRTVKSPESTVNDDPSTSSTQSDLFQKEKKLSPRNGSAHKAYSPSHRPETCQMEYLPMGPRAPARPGTVMAEYTRYQSLYPPDSRETVFSRLRLHKSSLLNSHSIEQPWGTMKLRTVNILASRKAILS